MVPLPDNRREVEELLAEAKYYLVQGLVDECQAALQVQCGAASATPSCQFTQLIQYVR